MIQTHTNPPFHSENSKILILGSFPSVKSRMQGFYYGHPQNRFWKVLSAVFNEIIPETIDEKKNLLQNNNIAVWDVIKFCEISGSSDSSITNVIPNNLKPILEKSNIEKIYVNGKIAEKLYKKHIESEIGIKAIFLPSTSPANASWSYDMLCAEWKTIKHS